MTIRAFIHAAGLCLASLSLLSSPVHADDIGDLDQLSRATDDAKAGLALARDQIVIGDLSGAMATLERLMINHPEADEAQLLHASLLCRLDDRTGGSSEFSALRKRDFRGQAWKDANAPCAVAIAGPIPGQSPSTGTTDTNDDASKADRDSIRNGNRQRRPGF